jgi:MoxR-like ATPase
MPLRYTPLFDPDAAAQPITARAVAPPGAGDSGVGDRRDGRVYVYSPKIVLAVNVALATGRPLLVRGPSGSGKSSLALHVAGRLGWRYYERVISSRTQAGDLLWEVDHLRRLQDAQNEELDPSIRRYIRPGVLWWAFDRQSAQVQAELPRDPQVPPGALDPNRGGSHARAVVLLDEIDKADPDVPNNLLVPFGSLQFQVEEIGLTVRARRENSPLVFMTTNDERELPPAFLRRCVELRLELPRTREELVAHYAEVGAEHFPALPRRRLRRIAQLVAESVEGDEAAVPSPAEYLDTVRACEEMEVEPGSAAWKQIAEVTLWKHGRTAVGAP